MYCNQHQLPFQSGLRAISAAISLLELKHANQPPTKSGTSAAIKKAIADVLRLTGDELSQVAQETRKQIATLHKVRWHLGSLELSGIRTYDDLPDCIQSAAATCWYDCEDFDNYACIMDAIDDLDAVFDQHQKYLRTALAEIECYLPETATTDTISTTSNGPAIHVVGR